VKSIIILFLCLLLASVTQAATDFAMAPHPRLFLRAATNPPDLTGSAWLDTLRARCAEGKSLRHVYELSYDKAYDEMNVQADHDPYYLMPIVFTALIENDADLRTYAIDTIIAHKAEVTGTGYVIGDVEETLLAYDWMYPYMTQSQRDEVGSIIGTDLADTYNDNLTRYPWIPLTMHEMLQMIAVYGDTAAAGTYYCTDQDPNFATLREKVTYTDTETGTSKGYLTALDEVASKGAITGYGAVRYAAMIMNIESLHSSLGENWVTSSPFLQNIGTYHVNLMRTDNIYPRTVGKYNPYMGQYLYIAWAGNMANDPCANWYATDLLKESDGDGSGVGLYNEWIARDVWMIMLWHTPWKDKTQFPTSLTYYDPGAQVILARDRWKRSALPASAADSNTVVSMQYFGGANTSGATASNHFLIDRGNDPIVMAGGGYADTDRDLNFYPWYSTSLAWNCLKTGTGNEYYGHTSTSAGVVITCLADSVHHAHSRMQRLVGYEENGINYACSDSATIYYPKAGTWGYGGRINAVVDAPSYLYIRGDNTASYTIDCDTASVISVKREMIWSRPRFPKDVSIFFVRDFIVPNTGVTVTSSSVIHTLNRPIPLNDTPTKVTGKLWDATADSGGVYTTLPRQIAITSGTSKAILCFFKTATDSGTVSLIGGASADNAYWKQNVDSDCDNYDTHPSYEFYSVEAGKNYIGAGSPTTRRSIPGAEAADWRIEINAGATSSPHEILYAFVVGDSTAITNAVIEPSYFINTPGDLEIAQINYNDQIIRVGFTKSRDDDGNFHWYDRICPCGVIIAE
jgi:hypothetical protein